MRFEMKMPDLATNDADIRIVRWLIEPGQPIERGRPLLEVETDKAAMEVESAVSGILHEVRTPAGEAVAVGTVIAVLEVEEDKSWGGSCTAAPSLSARGGSTTATPTAPAPLPLAGEGRAETSPKPRGMFARNRAAAAAGSAASVAETTTAKPSPAASPAAISLSVAHRVAGKLLQESKQTIPHFYLQTSLNAAALIARRKEAEPAKLVWEAFFVSAIARVLARFDRFRCRFDGERLLPAETDAIGVAVDVEGDLFVVPIASPAAKTPEQISDEVRQSVRRLRAGDAEAKKIRPALLTITNLGICNVESFIPIIRPPEPAILGIGKIGPEVVGGKDGSIVVQQRCRLTLCVDHRVCSGKYAGDFLGAIVKELEVFQDLKI
jgi:pyruvate dehydrogenase E2 component (dihydrolipoamide acetyltransferase)